MRTSIRLLVLISLPLFACHPSLAADPAEHDVAVKAIEASALKVYRDKADPSKVARVFFGCHYGTPAILPKLAQLPELRDLNIRLEGGVTERDLEVLRQLKALEIITLHHCKEGGDELLAQVPHMPALKELNLSSVPVSDRGLKHLHGLKQLRIVRISRCDGVTPAGLAALRAALPEATVKD